MNFKDELTELIQKHYKINDYYINKIIDTAVSDLESYSKVPEDSRWNQWFPNEIIKAKFGNDICEYVKKDILEKSDYNIHYMQYSDMPEPKNDHEKGVLQVVCLIRFLIHCMNPS